MKAAMMTRVKTSSLFLAVAVALVGGAARADDPDPATLYKLHTAETSPKVKAGEKGKWILEIRPQGGAHVSEEAPLRIELAGTHVTPDKAKLARADAVGKGPIPRFEVPFTGSEAGKGSVDANVTFFICTEKVCARQQQKLSVPVEVN